MGFLVSLALPFVAALWLAAICVFLWHGELSRPGLFFVLSILVALGTHRAASALLEFGKMLFGGSGYFLEHRENPRAIELLEESLTVEAFVLTAIAVGVSYALLLWLKNSM